MSDETPDIRELIERGSLGTPEAKALRASVSREDVERVLALAKRLEVADRIADEHWITRHRYVHCVGCGWVPDRPDEDSLHSTRRHIAEVALAWSPEPVVEQAVILERPQGMPCSPLEPYDFGAIIPGACLVDINPDEWRPL